MSIKRTIKSFIGKVLKSIGLRKFVLRVLHHGQSPFEYRVRKILKDKNFGREVIEEGLEKIKVPEGYEDKKLILVLGSIVGDERECNYLNSIASMLEGTDKRLLLITEASLAKREFLDRIKFPLFKVPPIIGKNIYVKNLTVDKLFDLKEDRLKWGAANLSLRHRDMGEGYANQVAYYAEQFYEGLYSKLKPYKIIIWNNLYGVHHIADELAKIKNISTIYMEFGSIPGTITFDKKGQMGESEVARDFTDFKNLAVSEAEITEAQKVWNYLKESRLNRNNQSTSEEVIQQLKKLKNNKPLIFFAGQNDFESGLQPYTERTRQWHSPMFKTSNEGLKYVAEICRKNDWNIIYKPHPLMSMLGVERDDYPENAIIIENADINDLIDFSDVTITILSQTGYVSCVREKATLMLGYNQLKGKDCTYEAFELDKIESVLADAVKNGFTDSQKNAFRKHIAQLLKYNLFDDLQPTHIRYGQKIENIKNLLNENI